VKIGRSNEYVNGQQTYVITYQVENALLFLRDHDELYWNVTGNMWKAMIQEATADVFLDTKELSRQLWAAAYTGVYGSTESECVFKTTENRGTFSTQRRLNPGEGFTIAFGWDRELLAPPSSWKKFLWAMNPGENWVFLIPVFSLLVMTGLWFWRGRDPKVGESIQVMYKPPTFEGRP